MNPILRKELRSLLRERRGWLVPVCYAAVLSAVVYLVLAPTVRGGASGTEVGQTLAGVVAVVQAIALLLVAPLVGAATIAGERERGTLTALLASPVSRRALGLGKAAAAILYTLVLMTGSLPVAAVSLFFGGPDAATLAGLYTTHAVVAVALVCVGMAISTLFQRTWAATLLAIGTTLGLVVLTLAVFAATGGMRAHGFEPPHTLVLAFNPGYGLALFFGGDEIGSRAAWLEHYAAMLVLAATGLGVAVSRLRRMRD